MHNLIPCHVQNLLLGLRILLVVGTMVELLMVVDLVVVEQSTFIEHIVAAPRPSIFDYMVDAVQTTVVA